MLKKISYFVLLFALTLSFQAHSFNQANVSAEKQNPNETLSLASFYQANVSAEKQNPNEALSLASFYQANVSAKKQDPKRVLSSVNSREAPARIYTPQLVIPFQKIPKGKEALLGLLIQLEPDWYTYWSYAGDYGQSPKFQWKLPPSVSIKNLDYPIPERYSFKIGDDTFSSFIYKKEVLIPFAITIPKNYQPKTMDIQLDLELYACKDVCLAQRETLNMSFPLQDYPTNDLANKALGLPDEINKAAMPFSPASNINEANKVASPYKTLFNHWEKQRTKNINIKSEYQDKHTDVFLIHFYFEEYLKCLDVFPKSYQDFSSQSPILIGQTNHSCSFELQKTESQIPVLSGLLVYQQNSQKKSILFKSYKKHSLGLLWFILMAFLGGLLLNVMPCVLPILFLKFYNTFEIIHESKTKIILLNLSYVAGVILSFLALAFFILISKQAGKALGWGFHLQSPLFVISLCLLFFFMAFYLLNLFQVPMPKFAIQFKNKKMFSHFITGVMSTTAASPCTVPFMASAVGFAFSRSIVEVFIIFFFLGLGLSFPYIILSFFPSLFHYIPKPKKWMERVKKLLSIPLFLTVVWFLFIVYQQLPTSIFLWSLLVFPVSGFFIYAQNKISNLTLKNVLMWLSLAFVLFILFSSWYLNRVLQKDQLIYKQKSSLSKSKFLDWQIFSLTAIEASKQKGEKMLVAIGAEWCLTCKLNERIFNSAEVVAYLKQNNIRLYYGDWTNPNADIEKFLSSYGQKGVPFYLIHKGTTKTKTLSTLLLKRSFLKTLNEFFKEE